MRAIISLVVCITMLSSVGAIAATPHGKPTSLTSIGAVSDPDASPAPGDPGAGGSFDGQTYFQNRLTSPGAIAACAAKIEAVAVEWARKYALVRAERDEELTGLKLQYVKAGLKGLFELTYRVKLQTSARVTLNFYAQDGRELEPGAIHSFLTDYDIGTLEDTLTTALTCGAQT